MVCICAHKYINKYGAAGCAAVGKPRSKLWPIVNNSGVKSGDIFFVFSPCCRTAKI